MSVKGIRCVLPEDARQIVNLVNDLNRFSEEEAVMVLRESCIEVSYCGFEYMVYFDKETPSGTLLSYDKANWNDYEALIDTLEEWISASVNADVLEDALEDEIKWTTSKEE